MKSRFTPGTRGNYGSSLFIQSGGLCPTVGRIKNTNTRLRVRMGQDRSVWQALREAYIQHCDVMTMMKHNERTSPKCSDHAIASQFNSEQHPFQTILAETVRRKQNDAKTLDHPPISNTINNNVYYWRYHSRIVRNKEMGSKLPPAEEILLFRQPKHALFTVARLNELSKIM